MILHGLQSLQASVVGRSAGHCSGDGHGPVRAGKNWLRGRLAPEGGSEYFKLVGGGLKS